MEDDMLLSQPQSHTVPARNFDITCSTAPGFTSNMYGESLFASPAMSDNRLMPPLDPMFGSTDDGTSNFMSFPPPVYGSDFSQSPIGMTVAADNSCTATGHRFSTSTQQQFGFAV